MRKYVLRKTWIIGVILFLSLSVVGELRMGIVSAEIETVLHTDWQLSQKVGRSGCEALLEFLAQDACLLPLDGHLIKGRKSFHDILDSAAEKNLWCIANWEPLDGRISASGTFAYTYGRYRSDSQNSQKNDPPQYSYYATVWRKHDSGHWQVLYSMGLLSLKEWRNWDSLSPSSGSVSAVEQNLMDVDRAFSKLSIRKGYIEAFYTYIANDGINISAAGGPPADKETYRKRLEWLKEQTNPPQVHLVWDPILAHVASSKDLGFTTGGYVSTVTDPSGKKMEGRGYYLSIWQKQPDGTWKFVFDAGNQVQE